MIRLEITDRSAPHAFKILGSWKCVFYEDGQEPRGSAWIAHEDIPQAIAQAVVDAKHGRFVEIAHVWRDADTAAYLESPITDEDTDGDIEYLIDAMVCSDLSLYARYPSGLWLLSREHAYPLETAEERLALFKLGMALSTPKNENDNESMEPA